MTFFSSLTHTASRFTLLTGLTFSLFISATVWAGNYDSSIDNLTTGTTSGNGTRTDGIVLEYNIPIEDWPDTVAFQLQGGDGGRAKATTDLGQDQAGDGGGGAKINIEFAIATSDEDALKPGGKLRFIVGNKGESNTRTELSGGGGGGGTGILYLEPVTGAEWEILCIAGGGGGGAASTLVLDTFAKDGHNANTGTDGDDSGANGGDDGYTGSSWTSEAGGGGGWFSGSSLSNGGAMGQYSGGDGGAPFDQGVDGGFGCGAGGAGHKDKTDTVSRCGGGGGGGYSGGGAGEYNNSGTPKGGGGGSYLASWASSSTAATRNGSDSNGYIQVVTFTANEENGNIPFPTITLTGDADLQLEPGEAYSDPGAAGADVYGEALTVEVDIPTDLQNGVIGDYIVLYSAVDQFGGSTSGIRRVNVPHFKPTFELLGDVDVLQAAGTQSINNFAFNFDSNDEGQSLDAYEVSSNNSSLFSAQPSIDNNGTLTFTANNDATGSATVSVVAVDNPDDDDYGSSDRLTFTITVAAANKPTFDLSGNVTAIQGIGAQSVSDVATNFDANDEGQSLDSYEITNDNQDLFNIQPSVDANGTLTFTTDNSSLGTATISIVAIDNPNDPDNGRSETQTFTITMTEASKPTFDFFDDITVDEDAGPQSVSNFIINFDANDDGQSIVEYQVTNNNSTLFSVEPSIAADGTLTFTTADDTSGTATVSVVAVDNAYIGDNGMSETQTFTLTINPVDDVPTNLELRDYEFDEGKTGWLTSVRSDDPLSSGIAGVDIFYEIVGGADAALFSLESQGSSSTSMWLSLYTETDFDTPLDADGNNDYEITISVTNAEGTTTETFILNCIEVNEAPTHLTLDNTRVTTGETYVGILTGRDPNQSNVLSYAILNSADASLFSVDSETGEVSFLQAPDFDNPLDNNTDNIYRVKFEVSDGSLAYDTIILIEVVAFDNPPENLRLNGESVTSIDVSEGVGDNTQIAMLMASDPDMAGPVFFSLTDDADGRFSISNNNRLNRSSTGTLDYEVEQSLEIVLLATDSTGATTSWTVTINITDVDEPGIDEFRSIYGLSADGSEDALDWSGNGVANVLYLAFGLGDPNEFEVDRSRLPTISEGSSDSQIVFSFVQPIDSNPGITIQPMTGDDLSNWFTPDALDTEYQPTGESTTPLDDDYEQVDQTYDIIDTKRFYTIEVTVD